MHRLLALVALAAAAPALAQDACPRDPAKTEPGLCGCDYEDVASVPGGPADACVHRSAALGASVTLGAGTWVHAGAIVGDGADIAGAALAPRARVGAGAIVAGVALGRRAEVGAGAQVGAGSTLGRAARVGQCAIVGADAVIGYAATVGDPDACAPTTLGDDVTLGNLAQVWPGAAVGHRVAIGRGSSVGVGAAVGDDARVGPDVSLGTYAALGASSVAARGARLHASARVGAMARVGRDVTVDQGAEVDDTVVLRAGASVGEFAHVAAGAPVARGVAVPGAPGPTDCFSVRGTGLDFGTGPVTIDPDRDGPNAPYDVWCEMDTDGGGWTRVMIHAGQGGNSWWWNNSPTYYQGRATAGTYDSLAADHLSYAFNDLPVTELLLATPTAPTLAVQRTFPAGMSGKSMRALFADQDTVTYAPGDGSPAAWEGLYAQFGQQVYTHRRAMMIALTYDEAVLLAPGLTPTGYARNVDVRLGAYDRNNWGDPWHITYGAQVAFLLNEPVSNGDPCALLTGSGYTKPNGQHGSGHDSCTATGGQADWLVYVR